jgi:hypothetical protein
MTALRHSHRVLAASALLVWSWVCAACGAAAPSDYRPPFATIHGTLQITTVPVDPQEIRVALVWQADLGIERVGRLRVQDVPVSRNWPAQFEIDVVDLPPSDAVRTDQSGHEHATASIVAYRDRNRNEELDFTPVDADGFVDELIAVHGDEALIYLADPRPSLVLYNPERGWADLSTPITLYGVEDPETNCHLLEWLPRSMFTSVRSVPGTMAPWPIDPPLECPEALPPTATTEISCTLYPNETRYVAAWSTQPSEFVQATCGAVMRACTRTLRADELQPRGWPCPCDPEQPAAQYVCLGPGELASRSDAND